MIRDMGVILTMTKFIPHDYQQIAKEFAIENLETQEAAGLFLDMG